MKPEEVAEFTRRLEAAQTDGFGVSRESCRCSGCRKSRSDLGEFVASHAADFLAALQGGEHGAVYRLREECYCNSQGHARSSHPLKDCLVDGCCTSAEASDAAGRSEPRAPSLDEEALRRDLDARWERTWTRWLDSDDSDHTNLFAAMYVDVRAALGGPQGAPTGELLGAPPIAWSKGYRATQGHTMEVEEALLARDEYEARLQVAYNQGYAAALAEAPHGGTPRP